MRHPRLHFYKFPHFFLKLFKKLLTNRLKNAALRALIYKSNSFRPRPVQTFWLGAFFWNLITQADIPPTKTVSWRSFVNTIQMLSHPCLLPHGRSWRNSGTLTSLAWTLWWLTVTLISALLQGFPPTCSAPSCFLWSSRSLPIQDGLPTSRRTISMPSFPDFLSVIPRGSVPFMIFSAVYGFRIWSSSLLKSK